MRDLIVTENIALDGVIDATESWFDPAGGEDDVSDWRSDGASLLSPVEVRLQSDGTLPLGRRP